jgi:hypothetical protein
VVNSAAKSRLQKVYTNAKRVHLCIKADHNGVRFLYTMPGCERTFIRPGYINRHIIVITRSLMLQQGSWLEEDLLAREPCLAVIV